MPESQNNRFVRLGNKGLLALALFAATNAFGQDVEMADQMRASGKIYVVVAIVLIILIGLLIYLFTMDRKVQRLEAEMESRLGSGDESKN